MAALLDPKVIQLIQTLGVTGLLLVILVGGAAKWWVFGWAYDAKCKECEEWKAAAKSSTNAAEEAVKIASILRQLDLRQEDEGDPPRRRTPRSRAR
jgi:hypothetical protein